MRWFSQLARTQLFRHLEDQAALVLAFHYAHTDAVHSMQHFDLQPQQAAARQPQQAKHAQQTESPTHVSTITAAPEAAANSDGEQHAQTGGQAVLAAPSVSDVLAKEHIIRQACGLTSCLPYPLTSYRALTGIAVHMTARCMTTMCDHMYILRLLVWSCCKRLLVDFL